MAVLGKIDRAGNVHPHARLERGGLPGVEDLCFHAKRPRPFRHPGLLVEGVLRLAQHHEALLHEAEFVSWQFRQFLETRPAGGVQIPQQRRRAGNVRGVCRPPELPAPIQQVPAQPRFHVERRLRVPHPFEAERHHARRGQRHEMARHDHARVPKRAAFVPRGLAVEDRHAMPPARGVIGRGKTDDAGADDEDVLGYARVQN